MYVEKKGIPFSSWKDLVKFLNVKRADFLCANEDNCPHGSFQNFPGKDVLIPFGDIMYYCSVVILKTEKKF